MKKIIYLPFENLPQRYTKMWNDSFIKQLSNNDLVIWGDKQEGSLIKTGEFLDTYGTIAYKANQIRNVAKCFQEGKIENGDTFFVPDIFYPGLASIRYMAELSNVNVNIVAFNHAGRADKDDFVQQLGAWSDIQEKAWHEMCDLVLVGSDYHKERVERKFDYHKVIKTGAVWSKEWMDSFTKSLDKEKEDYVIWPHRPCKEKQFDLFLEIAKANPRLRFIITSSGNNRLQNVLLPKNVEYRHNLTKLEYYQVFAKAKGYLSTALQETFGYTLQEAIYFDCQVIVPNYACYSEFADRNSILDFNQMIKPNLITDMYNGKNLRESTQFKDNAKSIYILCKNLLQNE